MACPQWLLFCPMSLIMGCFSWTWSTFCYLVCSCFQWCNETFRCPCENRPQVGVTDVRSVNAGGYEEIVNEERTGSDLEGTVNLTRSLNAGCSFAPTAGCSFVPTAGCSYAPNTTGPISIPKRKKPKKEGFECLGATTPSKPVKDEYHQLTFAKIMNELSDSSYSATSSSEMQFSMSPES